MLNKKKTQKLLSKPKKKFVSLSALTLGVMVLIYLKLTFLLTIISRGTQDSHFNVMDESEEPLAPGPQS